MSDSLRDRAVATASSSDVRRFWSKVAIPDQNGCMLWMAAKASGYGAIWFAGVQQGAHRVSLILAEGEPPDPSMEAAHSCRNTHCVAPLHLRWATRIDNDRDKVRDGTLVRGERISHAKLTSEQVLAIRTEYAAGTGATMKAIGDRYGVCRRAVGQIINRDTWAWLEGDAS